MALPMNEIFLIAQNYYMLHKSHALVLIDDRINLAVGQNRWSDVLKWHRVKNRLRRLQMTQQPPQSHRVDRVAGFRLVGDNG
jgi:hypothetical protein